MCIHFTVAVMLYGKGLGVSEVAYHHLALVPGSVLELHALTA